jgi:hypothetical protein
VFVFGFVCVFGQASTRPATSCYRFEIGSGMTQLRVIQPQAVRAQPLFVATAAEVSFGRGFYGEEHDGSQVFRWMADEGELTYAPAPTDRFLEFWAFSEFYDLSQHLTTASGDSVETAPLPHKWSPRSIVVPASASSTRLTVDKIFPREYYPEDGRTLAIRIRAPRLHQDSDRHQAVHRQHVNAIVNATELSSGRSTLASTPPSLGIDLHGACNVKPPCVYCEWDFNKELEADHVSVPFTRDTLKEWGAFFDNSVSLVNCSIGEPFMMKNIDELLDVFGNTGKLLEMTTNGQILTDRNIQKLVGRPILLYISLDAATPLTYSRLRNDTFEKIIGNLRRLIEAKGGRGAFPHVHLVFMPMRCNVHELDAFVELCADLGVDRLVLRPLNYTDAVLDWERNGYHFEYQKELLPFDELVRASGRAARLCRELGVDLSDQMDFGGSMRDLFEEEFDRGATQAEALPAASPTPPAGAAPMSDPPGSDVRLPLANVSASKTESVTETPSAPEPVAIPMVAVHPLPSLGSDHRPACTEPWTSLYILRRGVLPCCYGGKPIGQMEDYREAWNGELMQAIRGELAQGRFHEYCLESPACPIVRKAAEAHILPPRQRAMLELRHGWSRVDHLLGGIPARIWKPLKRGGQMARVAITDPARAVRRARRLFASDSDSQQH